MGADSPVVCDASVLAAITFGEPRAGEALALMRGRRLLAPSLLRYELAQVAVRKCRAAAENVGRVEAAFEASLGVPVRLAEPSWMAVLALARDSGLTAYDAAYLQLALEIGVPLATLDTRLGRAADDLGLRAQPQDG